MCKKGSLEREREREITISCVLSPEEIRKLKQISINTGMSEEQIIKVIIQKFLNQKIYE